jgi:hypothetical protein
MDRKDVGFWAGGGTESKRSKYVLEHTVFDALAEPLIIEYCLSVLIRLELCLEGNLHRDVLAILRA